MYEISGVIPERYVEGLLEVCQFGLLEVRQVGHVEARQVGLLEVENVGLLQVGKVGLFNVVQPDERNTAKKEASTINLL